MTGLFEAGDPTLRLVVKLAISAPSSNQHLLLLNRGRPSAMSGAQIVLPTKPLAPITATRQMLGGRWRNVQASGCSLGAIRRRPEGQIVEACRDRGPTVEHP